MDAKKVVVMMALREPKKHSVRYDGEGAEPGITAVYLMNAAVAELGGEEPPKRIRVTIERM